MRTRKKRKLKAEINVLHNGVRANTEVVPAPTLAARLAFLLQLIAQSPGLSG